MDSTITITFGEVAENHVGMQKVGTMAAEGFHLPELEKAKARFEKRGFDCQLVHLNKFLPEELRPKSEPAYVLIIKNGLKALLKKKDKDADDLLKEHKDLDYDTKAKMRGRVVNKHARYNLCFGEKDQEPDYENNKGRIISFDKLPLLKRIRERLTKFFGGKAKNLLAESNLYYDLSKCGIGFHGDSERKKVIALRLGATMPLQYQWFFKSEPVGDRVELVVGHGDVYIMSQKATGNDWKTRNRLTLRHAAGADKFLQTK